MKVARKMTKKIWIFQIKKLYLYYKKKLTNKTFIL